MGQSKDTDANCTEDTSSASDAPAMPPDSPSSSSAATPLPTEPVPVFLDRMYTIVDTASDDVVAWSKAGDSFIVRQVAAFEGLLPAYYNHRNFLSFVRQLNFYGFSKVKRSSWRSQSKDSTDGKQQRRGSETWEFTHPKFRRGHRDLLAGVKRRKEGERTKRRQSSPQPDVLSDLKRDVEVVFAGLRAVEDKVDNIKSLLLSLAGRTMPSAANLPPIASTANIGYGSNPAFIGIPTAPTAPTAHGDGAARWSGDAGGGGRDPYMNGTPLALNYVTPLNFTSWQQHLNRERHAMPPQQPQPQRPGTDNDQCSIPQQAPAVPDDPAKRASVSRQLPLGGTPPAKQSGSFRHDENAAAVSTLRPPNRVGVGHGSSLPAAGSLAGFALQYDPRHTGHSSTPTESQSEGHGDDRAADMQEGLSEGGMTMLEILSRSAGHAMEREKRKRSDFTS